MPTTASIGSQVQCNAQNNKMYIIFHYLSTKISTESPIPSRVRTLGMQEMSIIFAMPVISLFFLSMLSSLVKQNLLPC